MNSLDILKLGSDVIVLGLFMYLARTVSDIRSKYELMTYEIHQLKETLNKITVIKVKEDLL